MMSREDSKRAALDDEMLKHMVELLEARLQQLSAELTDERALRASLASAAAREQALRETLKAIESSARMLSDKEPKSPQARRNYALMIAEVARSALAAQPATVSGEGES